ncbi:hypothetical protein F6R98_15140 [Candidatus Methylospira mobilis]|uniref:Uncharacterized protein n=1 Tax=Candidatus Methylospira mobilis TaxID=1808979 RepID=A0A5Q0BQ03_9GAMM|nr:hypothetical protein [Candidatus Methylospira mobilis]QFY43796.1 hypothetical protein F6R98_15140 [Candidatus Methylospira mobilis]WNV04787.1 hypothetical protein RP726_20730 [Candidatus Methylospira mobilis]
MSNFVLEAIHGLHGYSHEDAGVISGFFDDPESASVCAQRLRESCGVDVEVCGCQLSRINRRHHTPSTLSGLAGVSTFSKRINLIVAVPIPFVLLLAY